MAQDDVIKTPPAGEFSRPENLYFPNGVPRSSEYTNPYVDILTPTDTVLRQQGGAGNLKIYKELLRDDQVRSTLQQRRMAVTSTEWMVDAGAEDALSVAAADALRENMKALNWDDITDKMLYSVFYGWGVAEVMWRPDGNLVAIENIIVRDRARFRYGWSDTIYLDTSNGWEPMPPRKFWWAATGADHNDEPYGLGLAHSLYWPVFFKRNDIKFWLVFLERFGQPTAMAKMPAGQIQDPTLRAEAIKMLKSIATDSGIIVPDTVAVELLEATRSGSADYDSMKGAMDAAIAKIVLSQTMTTDDGSSRSQSETHKSVRDEVVKADADLICEGFRRTVVKWWTEWNFPGAALPRVWRNIEPPEDLNARAERDERIIKLGYEPTEEYVRETYGEGWTKKKEPDPATLMAAGTMQAMRGNPEEDPESFSEGEAAALQALKIARRADQAAMVEAAQAFAEQYDTIMGRRVGALLEAAEAAEDFETFRNRLDEMLAEEPAKEQLDKLTRGTFFARLMGATRVQRKRARA